MSDPSVVVFSSAQVLALACGRVLEIRTNSAMASGVGGARRHKVQEVSAEEIYDKMEAHLKNVGEKTAFYYGSYASVARNQAVDGAGLAHNFALLKQVRFYFRLPSWAVYSTVFQNWVL